MDGCFDTGTSGTRFFSIEATWRTGSCDFQIAYAKDWEFDVDKDWDNDDALYDQMITIPISIS